MTTVELYRVIEQQVESLTKSERRWVDDNWRSITEKWADELKEQASEAVGDEEDKPICGCCDEALLNEGCGKMVNHGCCSDGACGHEPPIEALCGECGTWDEEDEVWRCPDCQEEHENEKHNDEPPACETCKKPVWSNSDTWQIIHGCAVCQDCFDENEEAHKLPEPDGDGSGDE